MWTLLHVYSEVVNIVLSTIGMYVAVRWVWRQHKMAAVEKHLEDMRAVAFQTLKVKPPNDHH
jgi:hypothetical protein